jgi:hypothetical protein
VGVGIMSDKEKILKIVKAVDGNFENIIITYLNTYSSDFTASRLNNLISTFSSILDEKIKSNECAIRNSIDYATYVKMYLEGKVYATKEVAEKHVDIQLGHLHQIIRLCEDAIN